MAGPRPKCIAFFTHKHYPEGTIKPARPCGRAAVKGNVYCRRHAAGAANLLVVGKANTYAEARNAGRDKWRARLQKAKAMGLDVKVPGFQKGNKLASKAHKNAIKGRKPAPIPDAITRPKAMLEARSMILSEREKLPALPDKPFDEMEPHEKLTSLMGTSLDIAARVLTMPLTPEETPTTFKAQMKLVADVWSVGVKVDRNTLTAKKQDRLVELITKLKGEVIEG